MFWYNDDDIDDKKNLSKYNFWSKRTLNHNHDRKSRYSHIKLKIAVRKNGESQVFLRNIKSDDMYEKVGRDTFYLNTPRLLTLST